MADTISTVGAPLFLQGGDDPQDREFVTDFLRKSDMKRQRFVSTWNEVLENYLVSGPQFSDLRPFPRSNFYTPTPFRRPMLKDPETHQIIETLASQALILLLQSPEYLQATPIGSDDYEKARFLSRVLMGTLEEPGVYRTMYEALKDAFIFGTSILEIGYESRERFQMTKVPLIDELSGQLFGFDVRPEKIRYRDRPLIRTVDIYDFYPDPAGTRIQENMLGVAKRFRITKADARALVATGTYRKEQTEVAIQKNNVSSGTGGSASGQPNDQQQTFDLRNSRFEPFAPPDKYGQMVGFEFWGTVPYKTADGFRNRVITMINGEIVRSHINPFIDGNIPFKEIVMNPVAGRFYGLSPAEVNRFLQDSTDHYLIAMTEATNIAIRNPLLVETSFGGDTDRVQNAELNDIISCRNAQAVQPVPRDLTALAFATQEMVRRKITMREASGATNPLQAIPESVRQTATEINELLRLATQRVDTMVQLVERDDLPWLGRTLHSRLRQFTDEPRIATLFGEQIPFTADDIDQEADVRFVGSRQARSSAQKVAIYKDAIQTLGSVPEMLFLAKDLVVRYMRDGLEIPDGKEIAERAGEAFLKLRAAEAEAEAAIKAAGGASGEQEAA